MKITVDLNTSSVGFGYAAPGQYRLRIAGSELKDGKNAPYIAWKIEFADPNVKSVVDGAKVGNIFENTTLKSGDNAQFRLKQMCDALGVVWGNFDTDDLIGREFEAQVDIKEYNGNLSNCIKRFIPLK